MAITGTTNLDSLELAGNLVVAGTTTFSGGETVTGPETVTGSMTVGTAMSVGSNAVITGTLSATGNVGFAKALAVGSAVTITGTLTTTGGSVGRTATTTIATGILGELVTDTQAAASNSVTTTGAFYNISSISVTAGTWDVSGGVHHVLNGATATTGVYGAISLFSADTQTDHVSGSNLFGSNPPISGGPSITVALPPFRITVSSTTTVYLKGKTDFGAGNPRVAGYIRANRVV